MSSHHRCKSLLHHNLHTHGISTGETVMLSFLSNYIKFNFSIQEMFRRKHFEFHRECSSSYTHKKDLERSKKKRTTDDPDDVLSPNRKSRRVPEVTSE